MIAEYLRLLAHQISVKLPEILGYSVTTSLLIILQMSMIEVINGILQTIVLVISIAGGIATYIYVRKKTKNLDK